METFLSGIQCLRLGLQDIFSRKLRFFVVIPLLINVLVFGGLFYWVYHSLISKLHVISLPPWLMWLKSVFSSIEYLIVSVILIFTFSIFAYFSTLIANILACSFNGYLSEIYSRHLGYPTPMTKPWFTLLRDTLIRQGLILKYTLPRAMVVSLLCFLFSFIPFINLFMPFILYWFYAYFLAIQYLDYPADNFHVSFQDLLAAMKNHRRAYLGYGISVAILSSIPFINLIIMPAAVLGATRLWHQTGRFD